MRHLNLRIGAPARLADLRGKAERVTQSAAERAPDTPRPAITWRDVRFTGFHNQAANTITLTQSEDKTSWYCHTGPFFGREYYIDEYKGNQYQHRGWFTDPFSGGHVLRGLIVVLNGQRYLAGYEDSGNNERVYFNVLFDSIEEAIAYADDQAHRDAEQQLEYAQADIEANKLDDKIQDQQQRLREQLALRHRPQFNYTRTNALGTIGTLRKLQAERAEVREQYGL